MKKILSIALILVLSLTLLAGCGGGAAEGEGETPEFFSQIGNDPLPLKQIIGPFDFRHVIIQKIL